MLTIAQVMVLLLLQAVPLVLVGAVAGAVWMRRRKDRHAEPQGDPITQHLTDLSAAIERIEQAVLRNQPCRDPLSGVRIDQPDQPTVPTPWHRDQKPRPNERIAGPTLIRVPDLTGPGKVVGSQAEAARKSLASNDLAQRFARIWAMADQGASADRIAEATGQPIGQVELVLNLRRRLLDDPNVEVPA
ncbi:hypothetical protein [Tautonia rosea]|uniref:hypothetical protein n=1 Tax=Tautonia rosea TaxID=2728037 RepID=UPI001475FD77|nr:hypothetical protein [Tautonia rosea]